MSSTALLVTDKEVPVTGLSEPAATKCGMGDSFETMEHRFQNVPVDAIQHYTKVPDYRDKSHIKYPIVILTPTHTYCIEGFDLIEEAKKLGLSNIACKVITISTDSDALLALMKIVIRVRAEGGHARYSEILRNLLIFIELFIAEGYKIINDHGGDRKSNKFNSNKSDDLVNVLCKALNKERRTVLQYLSHLEYLSHEAVERLIEKDTPKSFFADFQKVKTQVKNNKDTGLTDDDITNIISSTAFEIDEYFIDSKNIKSIKELIDNKIAVITKKEALLKQVPIMDKPVTYTVETPPEETEDTRLKKDVFLRVKSVCDSLIPGIQEIAEMHEQASLIKRSGSELLKIARDISR